MLPFFPRQLNFIKTVVTTRYALGQTHAKIGAQLYYMLIVLLQVRGCHWTEIPASIHQCTFDQAQAAVDELVLLCRLSDT
jgi:hypothetical protein